MVSELTKHCIWNSVFLQKTWAVYFARTHCISDLDFVIQKNVNCIGMFKIPIPVILAAYTGCFKKSFTTLKA
jgi:hypothetical protein